MVKSTAKRRLSMRRKTMSRRRKSTERRNKMSCPRLPAKTRRRRLLATLNTRSYRLSRRALSSSTSARISSQEHVTRIRHANLSTISILRSSSRSRWLILRRWHLKPSLRSKRLNFPVLNHQRIPRNWHSKVQ